MIFSTTTRVTAFLTALTALAGCQGPPAPAEAPVGNSKAAMRWTPADAPSLFDDDLEYRLSELPREAEAEQVPWAGHYWPIYRDGLNDAWAGEGTLSPAAKYAEAFDVDGLPEMVSRMTGVEGHQSRTACETDDQCNDEIGEVCAKRSGEDSGRCIPTWWGVCHAWAPAAILFPEPKVPVTRNGVTFEVNDLKAFVTMMAEAVEVKFVSKRCNQDAQDEDAIEYDEYGRPDPNGDCIDTNPATFHTLLGNYIGLRGQSFVEDRTYDDEVWNQPLRGYRVTHLEEIDSRQANGLVGVTAEGAVNDRHEGTAHRAQWTHYDAITLQAGERLTAQMTGNGDADLYVRLGAQPTTGSYTCRPYSSSSNENCAVDAEVETQVFVSVRGYAAESTFALEIQGGGAVPADYRFNDDAVRFYHVRTEVDYIAESPRTAGGFLGNEIDQYTGTDHYEYVLEADAEGRLIGGEWVGTSKTDHPDFLWLPVSVNAHKPILGGLVDRNVILELLAESAGEEDVVDNGLPFHAGPQELARGDWAFFGPFDAAADETLIARISGSGDADLYVRAGAQPTLREYDCRPYINGSQERCELPGAGSFFIGVRGYTAAKFSVDVELRAAPEPQPAAAQLDENGQLGQGEWRRYTLNVTAGQRVRVFTTAPNDIDLYLRLGSAPTAGSYDLRAYTYSGNESLTYTAAADGVLHVAVHGYEASSFTLESANVD